MQTYELNLAIPANHQITLPAELPTGSQVRVIILTTTETANTAAPTTATPIAGSPEAVRAYFAWRKQHTNLSTNSAQDIEAYIEECRNDWD